jgi:uncharacterized protein YggT (Ycf19 family)
MAVTLQSQARNQQCAELIFRSCTRLLRPIRSQDTPAIAFINMNDLHLYESDGIVAHDLRMCP